MIRKFQLMAIVRDIRWIEIAGKTHSAALILDNCYKIAEWAKPGQFVMIWPQPDSHEHLLGRPFSICATHKSGRIEIGFKVKGEGTKLLAGKNKGDKIQVLGPLGNGFYMRDNFETAIIVAGGTGIFSLMMLVSKMLRQKKETYLFLGAKTEDVLLYPKISSDLLHISISTDDGSAGKPGLVTELLQSELSYRTWFEKPRIFACGPWGMLKEVAEIAAAHGIPAQVSVEERMACGVGACLGCAIKVKDENDPEGWAVKHVCCEGPVFNAKEVLWNDNGNDEAENGD